MAAASNSSYNDAFNPFLDDRIEEDPQPDFTNAKVVVDTPRLTFRQMMESSMQPAAATVATQTTPPRPSPLANARPSTDSTTETISVTETTPVLSQPRREDPRRHLPVYTVGWSSTTSSQMIPASGLDFLTGVHQVLLQQTVTNLSAPNLSEKRYIVKIPNGETLYSTVENSTETGRLCCGSQRPFNMSVLDPTRQEAAVITRTTGCVFGWCPCLQQELRVFSPGSMYLGSVTQDLSFLNASFTIKDSQNEDLFRVFGPPDIVWSMPFDAVFSICGGRGGGRLGAISREWNNSLGDYHLQICFPASGTPDEQKMLIISAALLIVSTYFLIARPYPGS